MMNNAYKNIFARHYDNLNEDIDFNEWVKFIEKSIEIYSDIPVKNICDIACGTGNISIMLAKKGYSVTAIDLSVDMLAMAQEKASKQNTKIVFSEQDMRNFSLYNKTDLAICIYDGINHLTSIEDVSSAFSSVYNQMNEGGIFIFDINSKYKFEFIYADQIYINEQEKTYFIWQNEYNNKTKICTFYLTFFLEDNNGKYERFDEEHYEKMYTVSQIKNELKKTGFEICGVFSDFNELHSANKLMADEETCERIYFIAKKGNKIKHEK